MSLYFVEVCTSVPAKTTENNISEDTECASILVVVVVVVVVGIILF